jgi:hypothetical protein
MPKITFVDPNYFEIAKKIYNKFSGATFHPMKNSKSKSIPYKKRSNSRQGYVPINSPLEGEEKGLYARTMAKFRRVPYPFQ